MKFFPTPLCIAVVSLTLAACEEQKPQVVEKSAPATTNFETSALGTAIDRYASNPTSSQAAEVDKAFAKLDQEIAELDERAAKVSGAEKTEAQAKAENLRSYRDRERVRYTEAKARATAQEAKDDARDVGDRVEETARKVGDKVEDAADAVKDGVENAVDKVKEKLP